jgi:hypothetical protein
MTSHTFGGIRDAEVLDRAKAEYPQSERGGTADAEEAE